MKGDFFHHKASNRIFPLDLLKSAGLTSGPGWSMALEVQKNCIFHSWRVLEHVYVHFSIFFVCFQLRYVAKFNYSYLDVD